MSADLSNYDIKIFKGNTYKLDFSYTTSANTGIDLSEYEAKMQIKRSPYDDGLLAELTENYPTGSFGRGLGGDFLTGMGTTGYTGGIILDYLGVTGDVHIHIDSETTFAIPVGKHSYDLQLKNNTDGNKKTILRGRLEIVPNTYAIERSSPNFVGEPEITGESG